MKWRYVLLGGAFAGVFSLGALFSPIGEPEAANDTQTAAANGTAQQEAAVDYTCPVTGEQMGSGAGMRNGNRGGMGKYFAGSMQEVIADALGITANELQTARYEGKSVADIAEEKGISVDELTAKMISSRTAELEKLVKEGTITQEQMDAMLVNMEANMKTAIERDAVGPMNGRGGGKMGMGHGAGNGYGAGNQQLN